MHRLLIAALGLRTHRAGGEAFLPGDCGAGRRSEATQAARRSSAGRSCEGTTAWTGVVSGGRLQPERGLPACGTGVRKECLAAAQASGT